MKNRNPRRQKTLLLSLRGRSLPRRTTLPRLRSSCPQALTHGGVALSERPFVCATRSTASSSPLSLASSAAERPTEAHHIRFAQPRALGRKVSDEYTVPVCRLHHRELHATATRPRGGPPSASIPCRSRLSCGSVLNWARQPKTVKPAKIPLSRFAPRWSENGNHENPANLRAAIQGPCSRRQRTDRWARNR